MSFKNFYLEEENVKNDILYHTTLLSNLPKILQQGIKVQKKNRLSGGAIGQDIRAAIAVFAFENLEDAQRWAFKTEWDTKEKSVIIPFKANKSEWTLDTHWEAQLGKGKWLYLKQDIPPEDILKDDIIYPTPDTWKELAKSL